MIKKKKIISLSIDAVEKDNDKKSFYVYILHCEQNSYYTGYTTDLQRRFKEHLAGTAKCKYTRSFKPLSIAQCWVVNDNKSEAMKIERYIKTLNRKQKYHLICFPDSLAELFECKSELYDSI